MTLFYTRLTPPSTLCAGELLPKDGESLLVKLSVDGRFLERLAPTPEVCLLRREGGDGGSGGMDGYECNVCVEGVELRGVERGDVDVRV